jgi:cell wall-associated NlpC family hydrolase
MCLLPAPPLLSRPEPPTPRAGESTHARRMIASVWQAGAACALLVALPACADGLIRDTSSRSAVPAPAAAGVDPLAQWLQERGLAPQFFNDAPGKHLAGPAEAIRGSGNPGAVAPTRDARSELVIAALNFLEIPYRWGGNSVDEGFDCSGFTRHVFATSLGLLLPRRAEEQARASGLQAVRRDALRPGDLVFFNTMQRAFSHVGIYIGEGRFIHAPRTGAEVRIEQMGSRYWSERFNGARRAGQADDSAAG